jgi:hypothetical protein
VDEARVSLALTSWSVQRGRKDEREKTGTGTATVRLTDPEGVLDPLNPGSDYAGKLIPRRQAALALQNPVTDAWATVFRGFVEDWQVIPDPSGAANYVEVTLVDALAILAAAELQPGDGTTAPEGGEGDVYFAEQDVDDRIFAALVPTGWPVELTSIFSGNVMLQATVYAPGTAALSVVHDAADAELPGVANVLAGRDGKLRFRGRFARFNPDNPDYGIRRWKLGDIDHADTDIGVIRGFEYDTGDRYIINRALCTPNQIADTDIPGQVITDEDSITEFGLRPWQAENLVIKHRQVTLESALVECRNYGTYWVENYKEPRLRVTGLTVGTVHPGDVYGPATWAFICGVEIGDIVELTAETTGGGGFFAEEWFVEGISYDVSGLGEEFPDVTVTVDVSPVALFAIDPFTS